MSSLNAYPKYPKTHRLENINCIISEKVDGTNGLIHGIYDSKTESFKVKFGSRTRYLNPEVKDGDNFGFASFYLPYKKLFKKLFNSLREEHSDLCDIKIYGEWFGKGIQRGYGLENKYFMPFNKYYAAFLQQGSIPNIIEPYIFCECKYNIQESLDAMSLLRANGSYLIPGYDNPEGIIINFRDLDIRFKETINK